VHQDWIFDLDGTLYTPIGALWNRLVEELKIYFIQTLRLPVTWEIDEQERLRVKWHTKQTIIAYLHEFQLDFDEIVNATHLPILHELSIEARPGIEVIRTLPGKKWLLTNSPESFAHAILRKLDLEHVFDGVYAIRDDCRVAKPDPESYRRIPVTCEKPIMIEDWHTNLRTPHKLGWTTVWFPEPDMEHPSTHDLTHVHMRIDSLLELRTLI
jgi:putative hydrolase of the HAD superfamily